MISDICRVSLLRAFYLISTDSPLYRFRVFLFDQLFPRVACVTHESVHSNQNQSPYNIIASNASCETIYSHINAHAANRKKYIEGHDK